LIDIESILSDLNLQQKELAGYFGVTSQAISRYKRGEMSFPEAWKSVLRDTFKINVTDYEFTKPEIENKNQKMVPYYAIDVFGTPGAELIGGDFVNYKPEFYISIPELSNDVQMYIRVTGDSMYPKYRHGDIIGIKEFDPGSFFAWYEPYVIITKGNYQRLIKYIHPCETDDTKIMLVSYDSQKYKPQPLDKADIFKLYTVRGKIEL
jgi:transcriptional regulator with XRE-family HTH domain